MNLSYRDDGTFSVAELEYFRQEKKRGTGGNKRKPVLFREEKGGCWRCTSHKWIRSGLTDPQLREENGYPKIRIRGKGYTVFSLLYCLEHDAPPHGLQLLHRCDHSWCCNPKHVYVGTSQDNMRDRVARNLVSYQKVNDRLDVQSIILIYDHPNASHGALAMMVRTNIRTVMDVRHGKRYQTCAYEKDSVTGKSYRVALPAEYFYGQPATLLWNPTLNIRNQQSVDKSNNMFYLNM